MTTGIYSAKLACETHLWDWLKQGLCELESGLIVSRVALNELITCGYKDMTNFSDCNELLLLSKKISFSLKA